MPSSHWPFLFGLVCLLGCLGSPEPYRPGYQERPGGESLEEEVEEILAATVPMEIERTNWYLHQGRQAVRKTMESTRRNPWTAYETDMHSALGDHAKDYLKHDPTPLMLETGEPEAPAEGEETDEWGEESTDDEWGSEEEDDWGSE